MTEGILLSSAMLGSWPSRMFHSLASGCGVPISKLAGRVQGSGVKSVYM